MNNLEEARTSLDSSASAAGLPLSPLAAPTVTPAMDSTIAPPMPPPVDRSRPSAPVYWRVEGSLLELTTVRPIAFFTWNSQTFIARAARRSLVLSMALLRPFLYAANRVAATRIVHAVLRGVTRDRLDLLGEEEFEYKLKPLLEEEGVRHLKALQATGVDVVLVSQGLEQVMRPLARHLGVRWIIANRLDFRNGIATGRLMSPVIRPRDRLRGFAKRVRTGRRVRRDGCALSVCAVRRRWRRRLCRRCGPRRGGCARLYISAKHGIRRRFQFARHLAESV